MPSSLFIGGAKGMWSLKWIKVGRSVEAHTADELEERSWETHPLHLCPKDTLVSIPSFWDSRILTGHD
jgi:hypothetical protein